MNLQEKIIDTILKKELLTSTNTGRVFVVKGKENFEQQKINDLYINRIKGEVVRTHHSLYQNNITHWTPNTYIRTYEENGFIAGHREENLRTINSFVIDIDTKEFDSTTISNLIWDELSIIPSLILNTPNGYQVYFVLETAFYINQDLKALTAAKEIMRNLKRCLKQILPIDENCNDFGFFRMPTNQNVERFTGITYTPREWIEWSMRQTDNHQTDKSDYISSVSAKTNHTKQTWFNVLLRTNKIKGTKGQVGRNNTLFTLALACYADGVNYEEAIMLLSEFNSQLAQPMKDMEFQRTLSSAYSGRYNGPTKDAVESLVKTYCPHVQIKMGSSNFYYKHAKKREDRVRVHLKEWEADLIAYINSKIKKSDPFIRLTQKEIMEALQIPSSTLNKLLSKSRKIFTRSVGKGRGTITLYSTIDCYMTFYNKQRKPRPSKFKRFKRGLFSPAEKYELCKSFFKHMFKIIYREHLPVIP